MSLQREISVTEDICLWCGYLHSMLNSMLNYKSYYLKRNLSPDFVLGCRISPTKVSDMFKNKVYYVYVLFHKQQNNNFGQSQVCVCFYRMSL